MQFYVGLKLHQVSNMLGCTLVGFEHKIYWQEKIACTKSSHNHHCAIPKESNAVYLPACNFPFPIFQKENEQVIGLDTLFFSK